MTSYIITFSVYGSSAKNGIELVLRYNVVRSDSNKDL